MVEKGLPRLLRSGKGSTKSIVEYRPQLVDDPGGLMAIGEGFNWHPGVIVGPF